MENRVYGAQNFELAELVALGVLLNAATQQRERKRTRLRALEISNVWAFGCPTLPQ